LISEVPVGMRSRKFKELNNTLVRSIKDSTGSLDHLSKRIAKTTEAYPNTEREMSLQSIDVKVKDLLESLEEHQETYLTPIVKADKNRLVSQEY